MVGYLNHRHQYWTLAQFYNYKAVSKFKKNNFGIDIVVNNVNLLICNYFTIL